MRAFTDQMQRKVEIEFPPRRIVSVVPSQTELLFDLGLEKEVCGITKFCIHPDVWFRTKTRVGGTKTLHLDQIRALHPDLILANKEENTQADIEALAKEFPVWISDIHNLDEALQMIDCVGQITDRENEASRIHQNIVKGFETLQADASNLKTLYLIWQEPYMSVNADTFIHDMLQRAGMDNVMANHASRYPEISVETLQSLSLDQILLSSEPFPFAEKHVAQLAAIRPDVKIRLVDGELFSWYGSRLQHTATYLQHVLLK